MSPAPDVLHAARARQREIVDEKVAQVRAALQDLLDDPRVPPSAINVHRISKRPDTPSHEFIAAHSGKRAEQNGYDHDLRAEIAKARQDKAKRMMSTQGATQARHDADHQGLHAQLGTYRSRLTAKNRELQAEREAHAATKRQLQIALGAQLDGGVLIDPVEHQQLRNHIERLTDQVTTISRDLQESERGRREATEQANALRRVAQELADELNALRTDNVSHLAPRS